MGIILMLISRNPTPEIRKIPEMWSVELGQVPPSESEFIPPFTHLIKQLNNVPSLTHNRFVGIQGCRRLTSL